MQGGVIATPELRGTILPGITRKSIIELATSLGFEVKDREGPHRVLTAPLSRKGHVSSLQAATSSDVKGTHGLSAPSTRFPQPHADSDQSGGARWKSAQCAWTSWRLQMRCSAPERQSSSPPWGLSPTETSRTPTPHPRTLCLVPRSTDYSTLTSLLMGVILRLDEVPMMCGCCIHHV